MPTDLERILAEIDVQDGTNPLGEDLTAAEWAKVKATSLSDYGSPVTIVFTPDPGFEDSEPRMDHGYLTAVPGREDSWDMVGIVHIPKPWGEKDSCPPEWHSLYSLSKNPEIAEIRIGPCPRLNGST